jgi:hypothetical protein
LQAQLLRRHSMCERRQRGRTTLATRHKRAFTLPSPLWLGGARRGQSDNGLFWKPSALQPSQICAPRRERPERAAGGRCFAGTNGRFGVEPSRSEARAGRSGIGAMRHLAHNAPGAWPRSISRVGRIALADRDNLHEEVRFAADSPLEGAGFEPSVPREGYGLSRPPSSGDVVGSPRPGSARRL